MSLSPYQRIMRAADKGRGVRLSAEDCRSMALDSAIVQLAENDDEAADEDEDDDDEREARNDYGHS